MRFNLYLLCILSERLQIFNIILLLLIPCLINILINQILGETDKYENIINQRKI